MSAWWNHQCMNLSIVISRGTHTQYLSGAYSCATAARHVTFLSEKKKRLFNTLPSIKKKKNSSHSISLARAPRAINILTDEDIIRFQVPDHPTSALAARLSGRFLFIISGSIRFIIKELLCVCVCTHSRSMITLMRPFRPLICCLV